MTELYRIITTVDITPTGVRHKDATDEDWLLKRNQQRNFDTLIQVISMRAQPMNAQVDLEQITGSVMQAYTPLLFLGESDKAQPINLWSLWFDVDRTDVFGPDNRFLIEELHGIPIVPNLNETVVSFPPMFLTHGRFTNTIVSPWK
mgnify:CR=1 FL=1